MNLNYSPWKIKFSSSSSNSLSLSFSLSIIGIVAAHSLPCVLDDRKSDCRHSNGQDSSRGEHCPGGPLELRPCVKWVNGHGGGGHCCAVVFARDVSKWH